MNTQETKHETQYSDIKVSKQTEKVFNALAAWSTLFESIGKIDDLSSTEFEVEFFRPLYHVRETLDQYLISSIIAQQPVDRPYNYEVI